MFQEIDKTNKESQVAQSQLDQLTSATSLITELQSKLANIDIKGFVERVKQETLDVLPIPGPGLDNFLKRYQALDEAATNIRNSLGLGVEKSEQFSRMVADNISKFTELGYKASDVGDTFVKAVGVYGANIAISNEDLLELKATSKVTGEEIGVLASGFRGVGIGIGQVGDRMLEVTEIARNAGVSVAAVSKGVVENLDKMNVYNFEGGVKGLAKMSAQATRLGIDMKSIFAVVDKVFNPEGAIELSAAMQRLGVQSNALLDPLRLMDLSQNDPTELQNQIVDMSKQFAVFNEQTKQFEIMPGEKRRLKEIAEAMGLPAGELQKMALNAANLDQKMKQIKFPSSIATKEDRELIATLASVNEAGIAEVRVKEIDEKTGEWTGRDEMVAVSELTANQIKELKDGQELQGKSMEEIAKEQLTEAERLNAQVSSIVNAITFGSASSETGRSIYELRTKTLRETLFQEKGRSGGIITEEDKTAGTYRKMTDEAVDGFTDTIKQTYEKLKDSKTFEDITNLFKDMNTAGVSFYETLKNTDYNKVFDKVSGFLSDVSLSKVAELVGIGGSESDPLSNFTEQINNVNTNVSNTVTQLQNVTNQKIAFEPLSINENLNVTIKVDLDPNIRDQALTSLATKAINDYFYDGENKTPNQQRLKNALDSIYPGIVLVKKENNLTNTG